MLVTLLNVLLERKSFFEFVRHDSESTRQFTHALRQFRLSWLARNWQDCNGLHEKRMSTVTGCYKTFVLKQMLRLNLIKIQLSRERYYRVKVGKILLSKQNNCQITCINIQTETHLFAMIEDPSMVVNK